MVAVQIPQYITPPAIKKPRRVIAWATHPTSKLTQRFDILVDISKQIRPQLESYCRRAVGEEYEILPQDWILTGDEF